jgi:hypothetical protein
MQDMDASRDTADESFHLPMLGLYADLEIGEGSVCLPEAFHQADARVRWRILADWARGLAQAQQRLLLEHPGCADAAPDPRPEPPAEPDHRD